MKQEITTLSQLIDSVNQNAEQPLLSKEEISAILREADQKRVVTLLPANRNLLRNRILKITSFAITSAAAIIIFIWKNNYFSEQSYPKSKLEQTSSTLSDIEGRQNIAMAPNSEAQVPISQHPISATSKSESMKHKSNGRRFDSTANNGIYFSGGSLANTPSVALNESHASSEFAKNSENESIILSPDSIEPIIEKRIEDPETTLGINFGKTTPQTKQYAASSPTKEFGESLYSSEYSLSQEKSAQRNFVKPEPPQFERQSPDASFERQSDTQYEQYIKKESPQKAVFGTRLNRKDSIDILLKTLETATVKPQMITLARNSSIVANKWNYSISNNSPDDLTPIFISLKGKESAVGIADYALMWLPNAIKKADSDVIFNIAPNPIKENPARISVYSPNEIKVNITLYDIFGRKAQDIFNGIKIEKGGFYKEFSLNAPEGIYTAAIINERGTKLALRRIVIQKSSDR